MEQESQRASLLDWLVAELPTPLDGHRVLLQLAETSALASHLSGLRDRCVVITESVAAAHEARGLRYPAVAVASLAAMPLATQSVGAIACLQIFDRVNEKDTVCDEWRRVARPGGRVLVAVEAARGGDQHDAGWLAFFAQRGFTETSGVRVPARALGAAEVVLLPLSLSRRQQPRFSLSAPFPLADIERVLETIDERLRLRQTLQAPATPAEPLQPGAGEGALPPPPHLDHADLYAPSALPGLLAPLFKTTTGGQASRFAKRLLNVPLHVFGRPQSHFNRAVRMILLAWSRFLHGTAGFQVVLRDELTIQRATVDRLTREAQELRARLEQVEKDLAAVLCRPQGRADSDGARGPGSSEA